MRTHVPRLLFRAVVATDSRGAIGANGKLPWPRHAADMRYFRDLTTNSVVVMGRKTWESIGRKPLSNRVNVVLSRSEAVLKEWDGVRANGGVVRVFPSIDKALRGICEFENFKQAVNVIGGEQIYREFLRRDLIDCIHLTRFNFTAALPCGEWWPLTEEELRERFTLLHSRCNGPDATLQIYFRKG